MKNVGFIVTKSEIGGAQTWVNEISNLIKEECNIFLITSEEGWLTHKDVFAGVLSYRVLKNILTSLHCLN